MFRVALLVVIVAVAVASLFYSNRPRASVSRRTPARTVRPRLSPAAAAAPALVTGVVSPPDPLPPPRVVDAQGGPVPDAITVRDPDGWIYAWHPGPRKAVNLPPAVATRSEPVVLPDREDEPEPGALRGTVFTGGGVPATGARIRAWSVFRWRVVVRADDEGAFEFVGITPATYTVEVHLDGEPTVFVGKIVVEEGATRDLGALRLPLPNRIEIRAGARPTVSAGSVRFNLREQADGVWITEDLAPGPYLVTLGFGDFREVTLRNGTREQIELPPPDTFRVRFQTDRVWRIEDELGHLVIEAQPVELQLVAGRYRLVDGGHVQEFVVSGETLVR